MIVKKAGAWAVVHAHPQKAGSKRDRPIGTVIKLHKTKQAAAAHHRAILLSQAIRKGRGGK